MSKSLANKQNLNWKLCGPKMAKRCGFGLAYHEHVQLDCQWLISNQYKVQ